MQGNESIFVCTAGTLKMSLYVYALQETENESIFVCTVGTLKMSLYWYALQEL